MRSRQKAEAQRVQYGPNQRNRTFFTGLGIGSRGDNPRFRPQRRLESPPSGGSLGQRPVPTDHYHERSRVVTHLALMTHSQPVADGELIKRTVYRAYMVFLHSVLAYNLF